MFVKPTTFPGAKKVDIFPEIYAYFRKIKIIDETNITSTSGKKKKKSTHPQKNKENGYYHIIISLSSTPPPQGLHLFLYLHAEALSLVQGKAGHQLCGQNVSAAQLRDHLRHVEEGLVFEQLPVEQKRSSPYKTGSPPVGQLKPCERLPLFHHQV